jgi:hypothetical protein
MKKILAKALLASLSASFLIGCTDANIENLSSTDDASIVITTNINTDSNNSSSKDASDNSSDASSIDASDDLVDDESTALISSSEGYIAACDLFEELFNDPSIEVDDSKLQTLKNGVSDIDNSKFIGTWNRTYVAMGVDGYVEIEEVSKSTCLVNGSFDHYGNCGDIDNITGYYLSENTMFAVDEEFDAVYFFKISGESMEIAQRGFGCMGGGVSANGTYVTTEPEYINEHDIEFAFTEDELTAINKLLSDNGLDYEEYFETPILYGIFETSIGEAVFGDGTTMSGRWFTSVAPHGVTRNLNLFISDDGNIYLESGWNASDEAEFYTTDENASSMPGAVETEG